MVLLLMKNWLSLVFNFWLQKMVSPSSNSFHVLSKQARNTAKQYKESRSYDKSQKVKRRSLILGSVDDILDGKTYHGLTDTMKSNISSFELSNNSFHNETTTTQQVGDLKSKRRFKRRGSCTIYNLSLETSRIDSRRSKPRWVKKARPEQESAIQAQPQVSAKSA